MLTDFSQTKLGAVYMKRIDEFPFEKARRASKKEVEDARKAIETVTGKARRPRPGRPAKSMAEKYVPVSLRLHPKVLAWLKREAKKRGIPYQSLINEILLKEAA